MSISTTLESSLLEYIGYKELYAHYINSHYEEDAENLNDPKMIFSRFLIDYVSKVLLFDKSDFSNKEKQLFIDWFRSSGIQAFSDLSQGIRNKDFDVSQYKNVFLHYYFLMQDALEDNDYDQLLDWLYQAPSSIRLRLQELNCFNNNEGDYIIDFDRVVKSVYNVNIDTNITCRNAGFFKGEIAC